MQVSFGEWKPDSPSLSDGARTVTNVTPERSYYRSFKGLNPISNALSSRAHGAVSIADRVGNNTIFAGDSTKLHKLTAGSFNNVSKAGNYTAITDGNWQFQQFQQYLIATNYSDPIQYWDTTVSTNFADLTGSPPKARVIGLVGRFVVLGDLAGDVDLGTTNLGIRWSSINNPLGSWASSASTQCGYQEFEDGGAIKAIIGYGNFAIIVQESAIRRMTYVGGDLIFQFDKIEDGRGTPIANSVVSNGRAIFYLSQEGFFVFNGQTSINIGEDKVDKFFWSNFDNNYKHNLSATVDTEQNLIYWSYPDKSAINGLANKILVFNWNAKRWALIEKEVELLFQGVTTGYTLDQLDQFGNLDELPFSLDSSAWTGGKQLAAGFDSEHKMGYFDGNVMDATLETGEFTLALGRFSQINEVTTLVEGNSNTTVTLNIGTRNLKASDVNYSSNVSLNALGKAYTRSNGMYHRIKLNISGGFDHAYGAFLDKYIIGGDR